MLRLEMRLNIFLNRDSPPPCVREDFFTKNANYATRADFFFLKNHFLSFECEFLKAQL